MTKIYERLARVVGMLPASSREIAAEIGMPQRRVGLWLRQLCADGVVARGPLRGREGRVWVRGDGRTYQRSGCEKPPRGVIRFGQAWQRLARRTSTDDLAELLGCARNTAGGVLRAMRTNGLIRETQWVATGHVYQPLYDRLPCPPVRRPGREARDAVNRRYYEGCKARPKNSRQSVSA